jgi:hypothetical protein
MVQERRAGARRKLLAIAARSPTKCSLSRGHVALQPKTLTPERDRFCPCKQSNAENN